MDSFLIILYHRDDMAVEDRREACQPRESSWNMKVEHHHLPARTCRQGGPEVPRRAFRASTLPNCTSRLARAMYLEDCLVYRHIITTFVSEQDGRTNADKSREDPYMEPRRERKDEMHRNRKTVDGPLILRLFRGFSADVNCVGFRTP